MPNQLHSNMGDSSDNELDEVIEDYELNESFDEVEDYIGSSDDDQSDDDTIMAMAVISHNGAVYMCAFAPDSFLIATGCHDDKAYLIDSNTQQILHTVEGHKDSVICLGFSKDGKYFMTGDMSGHIQVLNVATFEKIWEDTISGDLNWLIWHNHGNILLAGNSEGEVWMWLIPQGSSKYVHCSGVSSQVGILSPDGKRIAVGYDDGIVRLFDLKTCTMLTSSRITTNAPVMSLSFHNDNTMVLAGTQNGICKVLNSNNGKITNTLLNNDANDTVGEHQCLEVVEYCPHLPNYVVLAQGNGKVSVYDMKNPNVKRHEIEDCYVSSITWHPTEAYFYTAGLDGKIKCYDVLNGSILKTYGGHKNHVYHVTIKKDATYIMSSAEDKTARIFVL